MSQRKSTVISCLMCIAVMTAVGILLLAVGIKKNSVEEPADSYAMLELNIHFPAGEQNINIWQSAEGIYYFFLPSGSEKYKAFFHNLSDESCLRLDSALFKSTDSIVDDIEFNKTYEMELQLSKESQPLEPVRVIFMKSEGLPVLFIDTASGDINTIHADKEMREGANAFLIGTDGNREFSGDIEYITARGNSTFIEVEKKSYQIKLYKDNSILDMPKAKKWLLLANAIDDTRIKNELVFRFAEAYTEVPTVQGRYVDLYLNGNYAGNYYLCEKVELGENRLDITDLEKKTATVNFENQYQNAVLYVSDDGRIKATAGLENPEDISGGYLLEHIPADQYDLCDNAFMTAGGHCYAIVSPNPATVEQAEYICNYFNEMETAIMQADGIHPVTGKHFSEYLDVDSWTSKYMMEEVFHDPDASYASMFFYKDADSLDPHIFSGPMWDYDRAMGVYGSPNRTLDDAWQVGEFGIYVQEMMQHQAVKDQVVEKFSRYMVPYAENLMRADVYKLSESIDASVQMDKIRWTTVRGYYSDYEASCEYLSRFLEKKVQYLQDVWLGGEKYYTLTFLGYGGDTHICYTVRRGECLGFEPAIATYVAVFNGWYDVDSGMVFDPRLPVLQDKTYESRWIGMDLLLLNGLGGADVSQADPDTLRNLADQLQKMQSEKTDSEGEE